MVTGRILREYGKIAENVMLEDRVAYHPEDRDSESVDGTYLVCRENAGYRFFISVEVEDGDVAELEARTQGWINRFASFQGPEYVDDLPEGIGEEVSERTRFMENPPDVCPFQLDCSYCGFSSEPVDVIPKLDLRIDGKTVFRVFEEYCPECGKVSVSKTKVEPPSSLGVEMVDLDPDTYEVPREDLWEHSRINR
jgi:hypothetical protein